MLHKHGACVNVVFSGLLTDKLLYYISTLMVGMSIRFYLILVPSSEHFS